MHVYEVGSCVHMAEADSSFAIESVFFIKQFHYSDPDASYVILYSMHLNLHYFDDVYRAATFHNISQTYIKYTR